jgi:hypothetical protein
MPTPLWWFIKEGGKKTKAAQASGGLISETRFGTFFVPRIGDCSGWGFFRWWVLLIRTPPTRVVFVAASLEEMTTGKESQQNYYCEQGDRWEDGHRKSLSAKLALAIYLARTQFLYAAIKF